MTKYVSKPVEIDAVQVHGDNAEIVRAFIQRHDPGARHQDGYDRRNGKLWVKASQAWCDIKEGDYVIAERNSKGVYPCQREVFEERYQSAPEPDGFLGGREPDPT